MFLFFGRLSLPRLASAEVREAGLDRWAGEAARPAADAGGGLEVTLGVTTAGEPGPKSIRLSSVVSLNVCRRGGGVHPAKHRWKKVERLGGRGRERTIAGVEQQAILVN